MSTREQRDPDLVKMLSECRELIEQGKAVLAIDTLESLVKGAIESDDKVLLFNVYEDLAKAHLLLENTRECLKCYKRAMSISRELKSSFDTAKILHNMATIHSSMNELEEALDMYNRSSRLYDSIGDFQGAGQSNSDAATVYIRMKKLTKARKKLDLSLIQLNKAESGQLRANSLAVVYSRKGVLSTMKNDKNQALECFRLSLKGFKEAGNKIGVVSSLKSLVDLASSFDEKMFNLYFEELKAFFIEEDDKESLLELENLFNNAIF